MKKDFKEKVQEFMNSHEYDEIDQEEVRATVDWMDQFQNELFKVLLVAITKMSQEQKDEDFHALIMTGIARFACTYIETLNRTGNDDTDIFSFFTEQLLPVAYELVKEEMDKNEKEKAIRHAILANKMTPEEIYDKYVGQGDKEGFVKAVRKLREEQKESSHGKE